MLQTLKNAFKIKDVRRRIFYVLLMLVIIRIGSQLPIPGVDSDYFKEWFESQSSDAFNFFDAFTGGSFTGKSLFSFNITPAITFSLIFPLFVFSIPPLQGMHLGWGKGREKITTITPFY